MYDVRLVIDEIEAIDQTDQDGFIIFIPKTLRPGDEVYFVVNGTGSINGQFDSRIPEEGTRKVKENKPASDIELQRFQLNDQEKVALIVNVSEEDGPSLGDIAGSLVGPAIAIGKIAVAIATKNPKLGISAVPGLAEGAANVYKTIDNTKHQSIGAFALAIDNIDGKPEFTWIPTGEAKTQLLSEDYNTAEFIATDNGGGDKDYKYRFKVRAELVDTAIRFTSYSLEDTDDKNLILIGNDAINGTGNNFDNIIAGNNADNILIGLTGNDTLNGDGGNDTLDGGIGSDQMLGKVGSDIYVVDNINDKVTENSNEGIDTVQSFITYTLGDNLENLTLIGDEVINGIGNSSTNVITGNDAKNRLLGLFGDDTLYGGNGDDLLNGGEGSDQMFGQTGNDTYLVNDVNDTIIEKFNEGTDSVQSSVSYTLTENIEKLTLTSNKAINGTGNNLNNIIIGNDASNVLTGLAGNDTVDGSDNTDTISYSNSPNSVVVNLDGTNNYQSESTISVSPEPNFTIASGTAVDGFETTDTLKNLENIIASQQDDILIGDFLDNKIEALDGNDLLIGNAGSDTLDGGNGSDTVSYRRKTNKVNVNLETKIATEFSGDIDTLISIENVVASAGDDEIIGDQNSNIIFGEEGKDTLQGKQGDDKLIGGKDGDVIDGGEGNDTASYSTATEGITANLTNSLDNTGDAQGDVFQSIENLEGSEFSDRLFGDVQNNDIRGLEGDDYLDGLTGDDTMSGGTGNDIYKVESVNDVVIENIDQGIDTVDSAIDYTLGANLENLNLIEGTAALNGTGNELNNIINGNSGDNVISGGDGDDSITGGLGNESSVSGSLGKINGTPGSDILTGGNGNDAFIYNNIADSGDLITDFTVGDDKIVVTDLLQSLGYAGSDPITDGFLGFKQASDSLAVLQIDPDGAANNLFNPMPFILLDNVSVAALNDSSNFVF